MNFLYRIILLFTLLIPSMAQAQFYVTGDDPGKLKWNFIDTDNFRVIYPSGSDSLARKYAFELEKYKVPVSRSTGYIVGQGDGKLMPAVIHAYNDANGSVAWAPKRMDLFTVPSAYEPEPMPWSTMLAVHEGRHVTQMQFGMTGFQKPFSYAFGQMWNILVSLLYPGLFLVEGDAVMAETALTPSGRGRTADFLNYYRVAFDNGDYRSWARWKFGSQKHYTPDHYALGYMTFGAIRHIYDYPMFMYDGYQRATRKIFDFSPAYTVIQKNRTGKKIKDTFREVCDTMQGIWSRDAQRRAPFIYMEKVMETPSSYTEYNHKVLAEGNIYAIKSGYKTVPTLVKIDSAGKEKFLSMFAYQTSDLTYADGKIFWTETQTDPRWSLKTQSRIRELSLQDHKKKNISERNQLLFNPTISGDRIAATQYFPEGGSALYIDGESFNAPDSIQLVEIAWIGNKIYSSAISDNGYGIYEFDTDKQIWSIVLHPEPVKIKDFKAYGDELTFTCDRTGVNELYHLDPVTEILSQKTVTRYGAEDFIYGNDGYLYFSSQTLEGKELFRTPTDSLIDRTVNYSDKYRYIIAESLAEQERRLAQEKGESQAVDHDKKVNISDPKQYKKLNHMFYIHSWAPVYVNVDNIMNMSYDYIFQVASLGASAIMQNRLATGVGEFGYSAHKDPYNNSKWRHSGHFKFTYSGLYPVIETKLDFNDRAARQYNVKAVNSSSGTSIGIYSTELSVPYFEGKISTYVPLSFTSGGWHKGFIPRLSYRITNDMFNTSISILEENENQISPPWYQPFTRATSGKNSFRHYLSGSIRAYTMLSTANSAAYPRWGIGIEIGATGALESADILSPMGYAYLYGYTPGFTREQGLKLSVMHQQKLDSKSIFSQPAVQILPRGLTSSNSLTSYVSIHNPSITKLSADYAIPIYFGDLPIAGGLIYIKRFCLTPHVDYMRAGKTNLLSVGSALTFDLNGLIWIPWPVSIGATYSYSGLADYNNLISQTGLDMSPHHVGAVFNVSF